MDKESLNPHFEEYFDKVNEDNSVKIGKEIFKASADDVDIKTDLNTKEIYHINALKMIDKMLEKFGVGKVYNMFYDDYFRLKISKDRLSRGEFVKVTAQDKTDNLLEGAKSFGSLFSGGKIK
ncbi:MAG: hypothetical protein ACOC2U_02625 [bacterium]